MNTEDERKLHIQFTSRTTRDPAVNTMRKYQQLALVIISCISLLAFLFYKHEYDRLRYTLEYLETFGSPPEADVPQAHCGFSLHDKTSTPPVNWVQISHDCFVYSAFWEDWKGIYEPQVRLLAFASNIPTDLKALLWYEEFSTPLTASCYTSKVNDVFYLQTKDNVFYLYCRADESQKVKKVKPYVIEFSNALSKSRHLFVHESGSWKSIQNKFVLCVLPNESPLESSHIIEFISFHNIVGVDKFVFYGSILTPLARLLLDKYGEDESITYEEKLFVHEFSLSKSAERLIIQLDCLFRHRTSHEYGGVLSVNEFLLPQQKLSVKDMLNSFQVINRKGSDSISEFHVNTQDVCVDKEHSRDSTVLLGKQVHTNGIPSERGVVIIRPHIITMSHINGYSSNMQHLSIANLVVYNYYNCTEEQHTDSMHLPSNTRYVDMIINSLLMRKYKVYR